MEGQQRVGVLVELPQVLRELGQDPTQLIASVGIDPDKLSDPENSLTFVELGKLVQTCVAATGCEHFGLLVGQRSATHCLGLVGRLMRTAPTLKDAILDLCINQQRYVRGAVTYLYVQNETAFWGYTVHHPTMQSADQISEGAITLAFNIIQELIGIPPYEVLLARRAMGDIAPYRRVFGQAPTFDAQQYAIVFPAKLLDHFVKGADAKLRRKLQKSVADYWALTQPSVTQAVVRLLHARVIFPDVTLEALANELAMRPRTLNRRLNEEGAKFRDLVSQVRFSVSRQLLSGTGLDVSDIAFALGYANLSGFTHAFQKWSGMAPSEWRMQP
jgi:AraC-like DNA-binding protein